MSDGVTCPACHGAGRILWADCGWCGTRFQVPLGQRGRPSVYCGLVCAHEARKRVQRESVRRYRAKRASASMILAAMQRADAAAFARGAVLAGWRPQEAP